MKDNIQKESRERPNKETAYEMTENSSSVLDNIYWWKNQWKIK
jgi:hypothetical protein